LETQVTRIGILGANGQVGAEICLILRNQLHVQLIPICRNLSGSAFLRFSGVACRHGLPADDKQASGLLGDCDVVVNAAIALGTPRQIVRTEKRLIENSARYSKPGAIVIFFSTQMVHGDPRPGRRLHWRSAYGRAKLRSEAIARLMCRRYNKACYILRLGHVCGDLQNVTSAIRQIIQAGPVVMPECDRNSNTVYTATIVDAILKIAAGKEQPGVYDLSCQPEWKWTQVYEHEAHRCGSPLRIIRVPASVPRRTLHAALVQPFRYLGSVPGRNAFFKELALKGLAYLPVRHNQRAQAKWSLARARSDIRAFSRGSAINEVLLWRSLGKHFLQSLSNTAELLAERSFQVTPIAPAASWPPDLPLAKADA
jgi:nucleoside-diphosphate-sugar epimerase